ncbi:MAG TPA: UDP-N-acetylmuramoyl-tripeptide--D-alanyl-D-alanine ligase [Acidimicrobiales bacterium]
MTALRVAAVAAGALAMALAGLRWLRVAQREHYLPGAAARFARRWWGSSPLGQAGSLIAVAGAAAAWRWPGAALAPAVVVAAGPPGLGLRGRTAPLAWTRRLRTLAATVTALGGAALGVAVVAGAGPGVAAVSTLLVPLLVDLGCAITGPFERAAAKRHVTRATERLRRVAPTVVAITGSYGKTGTKGYVAHLLAGSKTVLASPASFNNRAGLARAVNENLLEGTDVFVAEMGTYGPGEIAELCSWLLPDIAVITAVGPVHLERFGTEDRILAAKAEILEKAPVAVLNVDDPRLAALAGETEGRGHRVRRVSRSAAADVRVSDDGDGLVLLVDGAEVGRTAAGPRPGNLACAVAVALELGVPVDEIGRRLGSLPTTPHRLEPGRGAAGFLVLDDTYNANPAGARLALEALETMAPPGGRRVVVTPGMVELGRRQGRENASFARDVARLADDLVVVGRTNRRALLDGARQADGRTRPAPLRVTVVRHRPAAVAWLRDRLGPDDIVLYENDLPDHYP